MKFERDVLISYAHIDNQPLTPEQKGWVTQFHAALKTMLSQQLGCTAEIWRDEKLQGNDIFTDEILEQFPRTATLVSVLSPRYIKSEWCTKEINEFCQVAQRNGGLVVDNKSRVFKVIKTPVNLGEPLPSVVTATLGYEFYGYDDDKIPLELNPAYGDKSREEFLRKINKLAWDIGQMLTGLGASAKNPQGQTGSPKPYVYLAECSRDCRVAREVLQGELQRCGYRVLPEEPLPHDEEEYTAAVERLLARCAFSIHLVGNSYGLVPDGCSQKSVVVLQNELAARQSEVRGLTRAIWLPQETKPEHPAQQAFVDSLHRDAKTQLGADLITGSLEQLKLAVHAALKKMEQPTLAISGQRRDEQSSGRLIYVLCDERDRKNTVPLLKLLKCKGFKVALPVFTGDATQVREANRELFMACDAIILFYGAGDEAWKFHQQNELRKMRGLRSEKPLRADYTFLAGPPTDDKDLLLTLDEPNLINGLDALPPTVLEGFVQAVGPDLATAS